MLQNYLPVLIQIAVAIAFSASALIFSVILGKSARRNQTKDSPYECGMEPEGESQPRFSVKFYLVAMLFILFDIEVVFMYPWAVVYRDFLRIHETIIFWSMLGFVAMLTVGYAYAVRKGVLDWRN